MKKRCFLWMISVGILLSFSSCQSGNCNPDEGQDGQLHAVFTADFSVGKGNETPVNWKVERHSQHVGSTVGPSYFRLLSPGNRYLPLLPKMTTYKIDLELDRTAIYGKNSNILRLFYRYDDEDQHGEFIEIIIKKNDGISVLKGIFDGNKFSVREEILSGVLSGNEVNLTVRTDQERTSITINGQDSTSFGTYYSTPSTVALEHGGARMQEVRLQKFNVYTTESIKESGILPETKIVFPKGIHMMDIPITYTVSAFQRGDLSVIRATLSGSVIEQEKSTWFTYHERKTDYLTRPYIKIMGRRFNLSDTTLVMSAHQPEYFYQILYEKPDWPLKCEFILEEQLPEQFLITLGYDHYCSETAQHAAGGPAEVIVDMPSGRILHQGKALGGYQENQFDIQIESSPEKRIISLLPGDDPRHEFAVNFARHNHYFMESEPCRFIVNLFSREARNIHIEYQIENAFFEPLLEAQMVTLSETGAVPILPGIMQQSFAVDAGPMENGVYHLRVKIFRGKKVITEDYRAFEVISREENAPSPPLASGLPYLYSAPNEIMNLDNDYFDPWLGANGLNVSHYISCSTFYPGVAKENRIWNTLEVYNRDWWIWAQKRTAEHPGIDANKELIAHANYVSLGNEYDGQLFYYPDYPFWNHQYRGEFLEQLIHFTQRLHLDKNSFIHPERLEREKQLSSEGMKELVENHWVEWLDFYSKACKEYLQVERKLLKDLNPAIRKSQYGPFAIYAGCYKMGWCLNYRGLNPKFQPEEVMDGFFQFEDYPVACGYNIGRGPLTLASIKLVAPELKIYPEFYTRSLQGCPDGAVYRAHPPYGIFPNVPGIIRKRIFEYVYGAVWHNEQGFDYWSDYGFHTRNWSQGQFEILINTWKTVRDHKPEKPLRSTAYVYSEECCRQHSTLYPEIINTAEEDVAFAWEMSRYNGHAGGFIASMSSLWKLSGEDMDCLVLPPLSGATKSELSEVRRLHSEGVALIGFEDVTGLEDLFGVKRLSRQVPVRHIKVNTTLADNPMAGLSELSETPSHSACVARYAANGASVLLEGEAPVLLKYKNTAMFNIPPTLVRRSINSLTGYGSESISPLINGAMTLITNKLGNPAVTATKGRVLAFSDSKSNSVIIVFADDLPGEECPINTEVTLNIKGLSPERISCDRSYNLTEITSERVVLQLDLDAKETATIVVVFQS